MPYIPTMAKSKKIIELWIACPFVLGAKKKATRKVSYKDKHEQMKIKKKRNDMFDKTSCLIVWEKTMHIRMLQDNYVSNECNKNKKK